MSKILQRARGGGDTETGRRRDKGAPSLSPFLPFSLSLLALPIFLLYNGAVYGAAEHERRDMSQRTRAALEEILSTEEFKELRSFQPSWWSRLAERLFDRLPGETRWVGAALEWLLYLIGVVVVISVFVFIAKRFRRLPSRTTDHDVTIEPQRGMDPEAVRMQAYEYSQSGDYRQAIRYLYLSFLLYLDKAGLFTYDAGKTNGEYVREIYSRVGGRDAEREKPDKSGDYSRMGDAIERFASLTLFFERKWYGMEESSAGDFRQCEETFVRLVNGLIGS